MALLTTLSWGCIPIFIKIVIAELPAVPIAFFRLGCATIFLIFLLSRQRKITRTAVTTIAPLSILAGLFFAGHYYFFMRSVQLAGPAVGSVLTQIGALTLALSGTVLFKEKLSVQKCLGAVAAIGGMMLFQYESGEVGGTRESHTLGVICGVCGGLAWSVYGICQKHLSKEHSPQLVLLCVFAVAATIFSPLTDFSSYLELSFVSSLLLLVLAGLTVSGYWTFTEALKYAPAVEVSTIAACAPLAAVGIATLLSWLLPGVIPKEESSLIGYFGAVLSIVGVIVISRR
ncbi:DMT family transporter [bacterium]|nr:DMT family transporter [bacterium]